MGETPGCKTELTFSLGHLNGIKNVHIALVKIIRLLRENITFVHSECPHFGGKSRVPLDWIFLCMSPIAVSTLRDVIVRFQISHVCCMGWGDISLQHTDPDYSAAYVVLETDAEDGLKGHGITFTLGKGTEVGELDIFLQFQNLHFRFQF